MNYTEEQFAEVLAKQKNLKPTGNLRRQPPMTENAQSPAKLPQTPTAAPPESKGGKQSSTAAKQNKPATVKSKYFAEKTTIDGLVFDSKKEADRWAHLSLLQRAGGITGLRRQVSLAVDINGKRICRYVADFCYFEQGREVVEDCKSTYTSKLQLYVLKKKLVLAVLGIAIRESI